MARATLKRTSMMFFTSTKTSLRHPENSSARENRDLVYQQLRDAAKMISTVTQGQFVPPATTLGDLTQALNDFDVEKFDRSLRIKNEEFLVLETCLSETGEIQRTSSSTTIGRTTGNHHFRCGIIGRFVINA